VSTADASPVVAPARAAYRVGVQPPAVIPMFPLPDHVQLIGLPTPYRVFEPRYRALVDQLIGQPPAERWLAVPRLAAGWEDDYLGAPAIRDLAAVGLVRNIRPLDEGQFLIVIEGLARCRLVELPSPHLFRLARPELVVDLPGALPDERFAAVCDEVFALVDALCRRLGPRGQAVSALVGNRAELPPVIERLGAALIGDLEVRQCFLDARSCDQRAELLRDSLSRVLATPPGGRASPLRGPSEN